MFRIIISGITSTRHKTLAAAEKKARALKNAEKKKYWLISDYAIFEELPDYQTARIFEFDNGLDIFGVAVEPVAYRAEEK